VATKVRGINDMQVPGLRQFLRDLNKLDTQGKSELRKASVDIARRLMVPAWSMAALEAKGNWGDKIMRTVKAKSDRIPVVTIGANRLRAYSKGASVNMIKTPSAFGVKSKTRRSTDPRANSALVAFGEGTGWMKGVGQSYKEPAMRQWGQAVDKVVNEWQSRRVTY
jgi:hypothetical protein